MIAYRRLYMIAGILIIWPMSSIFISAIDPPDSAVMVIPVLIVATWWYAFASLSDGGRRSLVVSLVVPILLWVLFAPMIVEGIMKVRQYGRLDGPHGDGSPILLAFEFATVVCVLLSLTLLIMRGVAALWKGRSQPLPSSDETPVVPPVE